MCKGKRCYLVYIHVFGEKGDIIPYLHTLSTFTTRVLSCGELKFKRSSRLPDFYYSSTLRYWGWQCSIIESLFSLELFRCMRRNSTAFMSMKSHSTSDMELFLTFKNSHICIHLYAQCVTRKPSKHFFNRIHPNSMIYIAQLKGLLLQLLFANNVLICPPSTLPM